MFLEYVGMCSINQGSIHHNRFYVKITCSEMHEYWMYISIIPIFLCSSLGLVMPLAFLLKTGCFFSLFHMFPDFCLIHDDHPKFIVCISVPLGAVYNFFWVTLHKLCFPCCIECSEWQPEVRGSLQLDSGGLGQLTDKWWIPGQRVRWLPGEELLILVQVAVRHLSSQTFKSFSGLLTI